MTGLDWLIVAILAISVLLATAHGFFYELFVLAGSVLGYLLAAWNYKRLGAWFLSYAKNEWIAQGTAFLAIFVCVVFLAGVAGRLARWAAQGAGLRWFDRFLGAAFGILRGALIVMVLVMSMAAFGGGSRLLAESRLGSYFLLLGRGASWAAPAELRTRFRDGLQRLSDMHVDSQQASGARKK